MNKYVFTLIVTLLLCLTWVETKKLSSPPKEPTTPVENNQEHCLIINNNLFFVLGKEGTNWIAVQMLYSRKGTVLVQKTFSELTYNFMLERKFSTKVSCPRIVRNRTPKLGPKL